MTKDFEKCLLQVPRTQSDMFKCLVSSVQEAKTIKTNKAIQVYDEISREKQLHFS